MTKNEETVLLTALIDLAKEVLELKNMVKSLGANQKAQETHNHYHNYPTVTPTPVSPYPNVPGYPIWTCNNSNGVGVK